MNTLLHEHTLGVMKKNQAAEQLDFKITEIGRQANAKW
jgi:hypothetical protein